jgi:hypothetical protein
MLALRESIRNLDTFLDEIKELLVPYSGKPKVGSQAQLELDQCPDLAVQLKVAHSQYWILLETACDHAAALPKLYQEPAVSVAPWTCVRGLLEAASVAAWLADPTISPRERVARSYSRRYDELKQQLSLLRTIGDAQMASLVSTRLSNLTAEVKRIGFDIPKDKKGKQIGIAITFPETTELIKLTLGQEADYRLLSGFAHAQTWAVHQGSFRKLPNEVINEMSGYDLEETKLAKFIYPEVVNYLCWTSISAIGHVLIYGFTLFGGDKDALRTALERRYEATSTAKWHRAYWR